jgi:hypothetical protein
MIMEAVSTSQTLVSIYQTTWHNIPEESVKTWNLTKKIKIKYFIPKINFP